MTYTNEITVSTKALKAAKNSLGTLIEETAEMVAQFEALSQTSEELGLPLDSQIMSDCEQMFIAINRLLYEQDSKLKHLQMMQVAAKKASEVVGEFRGRYAANSAQNPAPTLFNQAI